MWGLQRQWAKVLSLLQVIFLLFLNAEVICFHCRLDLAGQTSRNKVLEKIAKKYFKNKK